MKVSLIVAMDEEYGIGKNNDLMWHLPVDMKFFREKTTGHVVVMGRKNYDSIPEKFRPLPNRENVILTRNTDFKAPDCKVFHSFDACMEHFKDETERTIYIIGGGEIYQLALDSGLVDEMLITHVHGVFDADTFYPSFDENEWDKSTIMHHEKDERHESGFTVVQYTKRNK